MRGSAPLDDAVALWGRSGMVWVATAGEVDCGRKAETPVGIDLAAATEAGAPDISSEFEMASTSFSDAAASGWVSGSAFRGWWSDEVASNWWPGIPGGPLEDCAREVSVLYPKVQLLQNARTQLPFLRFRRAPPRRLVAELSFRRQPKWVRIGCRGSQVNHCSHWRPAQGRVSKTRPEVRLLQKARTQLPFLHSRRAPPRRLVAKFGFRR